MTNYKLICTHCKKEFNRPSNYKKRITPFCSKTCSYQSRITLITKPCGWCNESVSRPHNQAQSSESGHIFCNRSCSASFNNTKKRKSKKSKCEILLKTLIETDYPTLEIISSDKTVLNGFELDIYLPELHLAIEWNGIVHYHPIYGQTKLDKIQKRDSEKLHLAQLKQINLIIIPDLVSTESFVKEAYHTKIKQIIEERYRRESNSHNSVLQTDT